MRIKQSVPIAVTDLHRPARRVDNVGEQHRGKIPIIGDVGLVAGEELGDLVKRRAPRFDEVVNVASGQLNVFRSRYVIGDVLAPGGWDERIVGMVDDQRWPADSRK